MRCSSVNGPGDERKSYNVRENILSPSITQDTRLTRKPSTLDDGGMFNLLLSQRVFICDFNK